MSYILEALKKAQAERALGSAPSLHAMPLHPVDAPASGKGGAALWVGLVVGLLVAASAVMVWRSSDTAPAMQSQPAPVIAAPAAPAPAPAATPLVKLAPMPDEPSKPLTAPAVATAVAPSHAPAPVRAPAPATVPGPVAVPAPAAALAAPEEKLPTLRELPEAIARDVPQVALGGYVYANNPSDRLLLVDKVLRHEGEELAPGLILEKLLPKAAVMNYKGYRYKIAY